MMRHYPYGYYDYTIIAYRLRFCQQIKSSMKSYTKGTTRYRFYHVVLMILFYRPPIR